MNNKSIDELQAENRMLIDEINHLETRVMVLRSRMIRNDNEIERQLGDMATGLNYQQTRSAVPHECDLCLGECG